MMDAMRRFGGETFGPSEDDVKQALEALIIEMKIISEVFLDFDISPFI
jgi:type I restriction enzyme R subunit